MDQICDDLTCGDHYQLILDLLGVHVAIEAVC